MMRCSQDASHVLELGSAGGGSAGGSSKAKAGAVSVRKDPAQAKKQIDSADVLAKLRKQGIEVRVASPKLAAEEADAAAAQAVTAVQEWQEAGGPPPTRGDVEARPPPGPPGRAPAYSLEQASSLWIGASPLEAA